MMRLGDADLRISPCALLLADHEGNDARQIRLECQNLQIQHQRQMILEYRWCTLRLINRGKLDVLLFFRSLNPKFYVSYRLGIFVDPRLIARAKVCLLYTSPSPRDS